MFLPSSLVLVKNFLRSTLKPVMFNVRTVSIAYMSYKALHTLFRVAIFFIVRGATFSLLFLKKFNVDLMLGYIVIPVDLE